MRSPFHSLLTGIVSSAITAAAVLGVQPILARGAQEAAVTAGSAFSYQGQLKKNGAGVNASCVFDFLLFDAASAGTQVGSAISKPGVAVQQGLFTVELDFPPVSFQGEERWLEPRVQCPGDAAQVTLPRQKVATVPYAIRALQNWGLSGNAGTLPSLNFIGTTDAQAFEVRTGNQRAWSASRPRTATEPNAGNLIVFTGTNLIGGSPLNSVAGGAGNVIAGGGSDCPYYAGFGGCDNTIDGTDTAQATIGGGGGNTVSANHSTVAGGIFNSVSGGRGTVGGGTLNRVQSDGGTVAGGASNQVNSGSGDGFIGGGFNNELTGAPHAAIVGGFQNVATGTFSFVGAGWANRAYAEHAMIPGGFDNIVRGKASFAAGTRAVANHAGSFVWADSQDSQIATSANDQVLIRAQGGLRWAGSGINASGSPAVAYSSNTTCTDPVRMPIDLPLLNGNPGAVIVATATTNVFGVLYTAPVGVYYNSTGAGYPGGCPTDKWIIIGLGSGATSIAGSRFNLWFVLP